MYEQGQCDDNDFDPEACLLPDADRQVTYQDHALQLGCLDDDATFKSIGCIVPGLNASQCALRNDT